MIDREPTLTGRLAVDRATIASARIVHLAASIDFDVALTFAALDRIERAERFATSDASEIDDMLADVAAARPESAVVDARWGIAFLAAGGESLLVVTLDAEGRYGSIDGESAVFESRLVESLRARYGADARTSREPLDERDRDGSG